MGDDLRQPGAFERLAVQPVVPQPSRHLAGQSVEQEAFGGGQDLRPVHGEDPADVVPVADQGDLRRDVGAHRDEGLERVGVRVDGQMADPVARVDGDRAVLDDDQLDAIGGEQLLEQAEEVAEVLPDAIGPSSVRPAS